MSNSRIDHHTPQYSDALGNFGPAYHLELIRDTERVNRICAALDETLHADSIHCELGAGTGIFSIYAARRCRKVYAVEQDPEILQMARANIERAGLTDKIELIHADALTFRPAEKVDTLLVEMMSIWCITEPQIRMLNHATRHILKVGGSPMPSRIVNTFELGHYDFEVMGVSCPASIPLFSGITQPRIMTTSQVFNTFDLSRQNPENISHAVDISSLLSGRINCARLSSLVQMSENITFYSTDSLMPQTLVPLQEIAVKAGDRLRFSASFKTRTSIEAGEFGIEIV
jgi:predicted RNA methylase